MMMTQLPMEAVRTEVYDNILGTIGNTPLVRLNSLTDELRCTIYAKVEFFNPGGSVKDRIGPAIIEEAESSGRLGPGGTIVESTSGNTGVGLAIAAAIKGYKTIFVMPDKMSDEKIQLLRAFGAQVVVTPTAVEPADPRSYYSVAKRIVDETPNAILANQYHNPVNPQAHLESTGPELMAQMGDRLTHLVAGMGTGGTITGVGRYLKQQLPHVKIVGVDPVGSILYELHRSGKEVQAEGYKIEGIGEDFLPTTLDLDVVDHVIQVDDKESFLMTRRLVKEEGIFAGGSCGAAIAGALKFARKHNLGENDTMVVILPDSGSRYLSKIFNDNWMQENGYLDRPRATIRAADISANKKTHTEIVTVRADDIMEDVVALMKQHQISQVPVVDDGGKLKGVVTEVDLLNHMLMADHEHGPGESIASILNPEPLVVKPSTTLESLMQSFKRAGLAVIVDETELVTGILTKIDLLDYLASQAE